jgi:hypothetical protein
LQAARKNHPQTFQPYFCQPAFTDTSVSLHHPGLGQLAAKSNHFADIYACTCRVKTCKVSITSARVVEWCCGRVAVETVSYSISSSSMAKQEQFQSDEYEEEYEEFDEFEDEFETDEGEQQQTKAPHRSSSCLDTAAVVVEGPDGTKWHCNILRMLVTS